MATKTIKKEIVISQQTKDNPTGISPITVLVGAKRLLDSSDAPVSTKIASLILGQQILADLKAQVENLQTQLEDASYEDVCKALIDEGLLKEGETPVFSVIDKKGKKISKVLTTTTSHSLNMDAFKEEVKDPDVFAALPDEYKKVDIQGKPFFTSLYKAGLLGSYEKFFSMEDKTTTGLKSIKTGGDE